MDVDPEEGVMLRSDFTFCRHVGLPRSFFLFPPSSKPMYNTDLADALVQYNLRLRQLYNIYLRATTTTILGLRGVTIPIVLVSSATDSVWQSIVLFKFVLSPYSDLKSEFLCQSSLSSAEPADPLNPPRMLGISPMPSNTTYHPYSHNPSALTEYLKQKLHQQ